MKKKHCFITWILTGCLILGGLTGCSNDKQTSTDRSGNSPQSTQAAESMTGHNAVSYTHLTLPTNLFV